MLRGEAAIATMESLEMAGPLDMVDSLDIASAPVTHPSCQSTPTEY